MITSEDAVRISPRGFEWRVPDVFLARHDGYPFFLSAVVFSGSWGYRSDDEQRVNETESGLFFLFALPCLSLPIMIAASKQLKSYQEHVVLCLFLQTHVVIHTRLCSVHWVSYNESSMTS